MLRATYSKNPTAEDVSCLMSELKLLSTKECLEFRVEETQEASSLYSYIVEDSTESYKILVNFEEPLPKEWIPTYNKIVNFRDRILAWRKYINGMYNFITKETLTKNLTLGYRESLPEVESTWVLNYLLHEIPLNKIFKLIRQKKRKSDPIWTRNFDINWKDTPQYTKVWDNELNAWKIGIDGIGGKYWNPITKTWEGYKG